MEPTLRSVKPLAERQPGGRRPAPGGLELVQAFANSFWDLERHRPEQLRTPSALGGWLRRRGLLDPGLRLTDVDVRRTRDVRDGLRTLLFANNGQPPDRGAIERLNRALRTSGVSVRLDAKEPPELVAPRRDLDGALGLIVATVALAQLDGRFARLKACPGRGCGWAFYDHSRNQASTWCAMSICGSREKAREYRARGSASLSTSARRPQQR